MTPEECIDVVLTAGLLNRNLSLSRPSSKVLKGSMSAAAIAENVAAVLLESSSVAMSVAASPVNDVVDLSTPSTEILSATSALTKTCIRASSEESFTKLSISLKAGQAINNLLVTGTSEEDVKRTETLLCNLELCSREAVKD